MTSLKTLALSTILATAAASAQAGDNFPYWYIGFNGQLGFVDDADVEINGGNAGEASFDNSWAAGISLGYRPYDDDTYARNLRFEIEATIRESDFDQLDTPGAGANTSLAGSLDTQTYMFNTFYDFRNDSKWTPYLGAGVGFAQHDFQSNTVGVQDKDTVFAWQGMAGFFFSPETLPNTEWGVGYRYVGSADPSFTTNTGSTLEHDFNAHNLEANARFRF